MPAFNLKFAFRCKGGPAGGAVADDRIVMADSVFVSGLPESVTETEIETFFGSIGVIKVTKKSLFKMLFINNLPFIVNLD